MSVLNNNIINIFKKRVMHVVAN